MRLGGLGLFHREVLVLAALAAAAVVALFLLAPIHQDPEYHHFADQRTILGLPNFWNVVSNAPFLLVALLGLRALANHAAFSERWESHAYIILLAGLALVAFGSGYYHFDPSDATLFWDRLPMTIVFVALLSITLGERLNLRAGRLLLAPLLVLGVASLLYWKATGDLRLYILVQFYPILALPLMLAWLPARYTEAGGIWAMIGFYVLAKALESADSPIWQAAAPLSGHPWKHVAGAAAMLCYVQTMRHRQNARKRFQPNSLTGAI